MTLTAITYLIYVLVTIVATVWVGRTLHQNGAVFLDQIFQGDFDLSKGVNKLLLIGFYLINFGYVLFNLKLRTAVADLQHCIEVLSVKVGFIIIVLGVMHFLNLFVLFYLRKKSLKEAAQTIPKTALDYANQEFLT